MVVGSPLLMLEQYPSSFDENALAGVESRKAIASTDAGIPNVRMTIPPRSRY
jgi:hypothetical protein